MSAGRSQFTTQGFASSLIVLVLGWVMIYTDRMSISPLMNIIRQEFGLSFAAVSFAVSVYFLTYVAFTIPAAIIAESAGLRKTMVLFFLVGAASFGFAGILGFSYYLLLLSIAIHGLGMGAFYPTAYTLVNNTVPSQQRAYASAIISTGIDFGTVLGLIIAGPVLAFFASWQIELLILSIPTGIVALLLWRVLPDTRSRASDGFAISAPQISQYVRLLKNKNMVVLSAINLCSIYGYWVILAWAPSFLQESKGLSVFYSGLATAIFAAFAVPSSLLISRYSDRAGRRKVSLVLFPIAALTIFIAGSSSNVYEFLLAMVIYGIVGHMTIFPVLTAWMADIAMPNALGASLALMGVVGMISSIVAPILTGFIGDLTGSLVYGFYLGGAVVLFGLVFMFFFDPRLRVG